MEMENILRRAWAEIDLDRVERDYNIIRAGLPAGVKLCCVVKANAYGHGAVTVSRLYESCGADYLAVSSIEEAIQLRRAGIGLPILELGFCAPECAAELSEYGITQCVFSPDQATELSNCAQKSGVKVKVHIKVDTGMARLGFVCRPEHSDGVEAIARAATLPGLDVEGIFTHFADANSGAVGEDYTRRQAACFYGALDELKRLGIEFRIRHCGNSGIVFDYPEYDLDMVRVGGILFGVAPDSRIRSLPRLEPAMTLKTIISHIKELHPGETVGYGRTYTADHRLRLATLPIGYADGLDRATPRVWINGRPAPIVGRICMDQLMADVSGIDCCAGDEAVIFGGSGACGIDSLARELGTTSYDALCSLHRIPRCYTRDGRTLHWEPGLSI